MHFLWGEIQLKAYDVAYMFKTLGCTFGFIVRALAVPRLGANVVGSIPGVTKFCKRLFKVVAFLFVLESTHLECLILTAISLFIL